MILYSQSLHIACPQRRVESRRVSPSQPRCHSSNTRNVPAVNHITPRAQLRRKSHTCAGVPHSSIIGLGDHLIAIDRPRLVTKRSTVQRILLVLQQQYYRVSCCGGMLTWYAQSKKGVCFLVFISLLSSAHCSWVGSTPVGLCAQACSKKIDSSSAARTSAIKPDK